MSLSNVILLSFYRWFYELQNLVKKWVKGACTEAMPSGLRYGPKGAFLKLPALSTAILKNL